MPRSLRRLAQPDPSGRATAEWPITIVQLIRPGSQRTSAPGEDRDVILNGVTDDFVSLVGKLLGTGLSPQNVAEFLREQADVLELMAGDSKGR